MSSASASNYILIPFEQGNQRWGKKRARIKLDRAKAKGSKVELDPDTVRFKPDWLESRNAVAEGLDIITDVQVKESALGNPAVLKFRDPQEVQVFAKTKPKGKAKPQELDGTVSVRLEIQLRIHWEAVPDYDAEAKVNDGAGEPFTFTPDGKSSFQLRTWVDEFLPGAGTPWVPNETDYQFTHHISESDARGAALLASEPAPEQDAPAARRNSIVWLSGKQLPDEQFATLPLDVTLQIEAWPNGSIIQRFAETTGKRPTATPKVKQPWGTGPMGIRLEFPEWTLEFEKHGWDGEKRIVLTPQEYKTTVRAINSPEGAHLTAKLPSAYYSPKNYVDHRGASPRPELLFPMVTLFKGGKEICVISEEGDKEEHGEKREKVALEYDSAGRPSVTFGKGQTEAPELEVPDWLPAKEVAERFETTEKAADRLVETSTSGSQTARAEFQRYSEKFFEDYLRKDGGKLIENDEDMKRLRACQQMGTFFIYSSFLADFHSSLSKLRNEAAMNLANLLIAWIIDCLLFDWRTWRSGWKGLKEAGEKAAREAMEKAARKEALEEASEQAGKEIDELVKQGDEIGEEITKVGDKITDAKDAIKSAEDGIKEADDTIKALREEIDDLTKKAQKLDDTTVPNIKDEITRLNNDLSRRMARKEQLEGAIEQFTKQADSLTAKLEDLRARRPGVEQQATDAATRATQADELAQTLEAQAKEQSAKAHKQSSKVSALREETEGALKEAQQAEREWLEAVKRQSQRQAEAANLNSVARTAETQAREAAEEFSQLSASVDTLKAQKAQAEEVLSGLTNPKAIEAQQSAIRTYDASIERLTRELPAARTNASGLAETATAARTQADEAAGLARQATEEAGELSKTHSGLHDHHAERQATMLREREVEIAEIEEYGRVYNLATEQKEASKGLRTEAERFQGELETIDASIREADGDLIRATDSRAAREDSLATNQEIIESVEGEIETAGTRLNDARVEASNLRHDATAKGQEIGDWETKRGDFEQTVTTETTGREVLEKQRDQHQENLTTIEKQQEEIRTKQTGYNEEATKIGEELEAAENAAAQAARDAQNPSAKQRLFDAMGWLGGKMLEAMQMILGRITVKALTYVARGVMWVLKGLWWVVTSVLGAIYKFTLGLILKLINGALPICSAFYKEMRKQLALYNLAGYAKSTPTLTEAWVGGGTALSEPGYRPSKQQMLGNIQSTDKAHASEITQAFESNLTGSIRASVDAALAFESSDNIDSARDRCDECSGRMLMFQQREEGAVDRGGSKIYQPGRALGIFSEFERSRAWRDYLTLFDWVHFCVTWLIRIVAIVGGLATGPAGVGAAFVAMQVADAIDILMGGLKSFIAMFGDLIPKDKMLTLATLMPWMIHAGCFKNATYPKTEWIDEGESMMSAIGDMIGSPIEWVLSQVGWSDSG